MNDDNHIERINALTSNARNTWFALLGVLVFVGITLMGVEHIDFYGVNRDTRLPLVDIAVPTRYFFVAAPILTAAIFGYFHLYLIRLWDALGEAPERVNGVRLGDAVSPWLVTDAALHWRRKVRPDDCTTQRTLEGGAMMLNILLAWGFGLIILWLLWRTSLPARTFWMSTIAALCFAISIIVAVSSIAMMAQRMRRRASEETIQFWSSRLEITGVIVLSCAFVWDSYENTAGPTKGLARLNLFGENLVQKPVGWLPYDIARQDFRRDWLAQRGLADPLRGLTTLTKGFTKDDNKTTLKISEAIAEDWQTSREIDRADIAKPSWHKNYRKLDLRKAQLDRAFLVGARLRNARLDFAILRKAQMEGVDLTKAQMSFADLHKSQMAGADLTQTTLTHAFLYKTNLTEAILAETNLASSSIYKAEFANAKLLRSGLDHSIILGEDLSNMALFKGADLSGAINNGGAIRFTDLSETKFDWKTDFRNAFMDGSVKLPPGFVEQMDGLCQRHPEILPDKEFYGRWRGWVELGGRAWKDVHPKELPKSSGGYYPWATVEPIVPENPICIWRNEPLSGTLPPPLPFKNTP